MSQQIFYHVDVNSAFLSWSAAHRIAVDPNALDLRDIPSAIGGDKEKRHGIILAKSTPAKAYHIQTGEPLVRAMEKCPALTVVPPDFDLYVKKSNQLMDLLKKYAPSVEQFSIDEAFCDMSGTTALYGDPVAFAHKLKDEIRDTLGFTVNIGVSDRKLLAKMASDFQKPDRVHTLFPEEIPEKMWPLDVGDLFFVGKSSKAKLNSLGILTIGDLAKCDPALLTLHFKKHGEVMYKYANGIEVADQMVHHKKHKGYGNSVTLSHDVTSPEEANLILLSLCETVAARLRADHAKITVIAVQLTDCNFNKTSRQCSLYTSTDSTQKLYEVSQQLFAQLWNHAPIRLIGVSTSKVDDNDSQQLNMFDMGKSEKFQKLDSAIDSVRSRFGDDAIKRAVFLDNASGEPFKKQGLGKSKFDQRKDT